MPSVEKNPARKAPRPKANGNEETRPAGNSGLHPSPASHALLAGSEHSGVRALLESVFEELAPITTFGLNIFGSTEDRVSFPLLGRILPPRSSGVAEEGDLLFVVSGLVRQVVQGGGDVRRFDPVFGRDPMATDLFGPGCFVGLPQAAEPYDPTAGASAMEAARKVMENRGGLLAANLPDATTKRTLVFRSNPDILGGGGGLGALRLLRLRKDRLRELLVGDAAPESVFDQEADLSEVLQTPIWRDRANAEGELRLLRRWFTTLIQLGVHQLHPIRLQLSSSPLLKGIGVGIRNGLIHSAAPLEGHSGALFTQGQPAERIFFVQSGAVETRLAAQTPGEPTRVLSQECPGDLVGAGLVFAADSDADDPLSPIGAQALSGAKLLVWDRKHFQRLVARSLALKERFTSFADPTLAESHQEIARVTLLVDDRPSDLGEMSCALALGTALCLAHPEVPGPAPKGTVWLVDLSGQHLPGVEDSKRPGSGWVKAALGANMVPFDPDSLSAQDRGEMPAFHGVASVSLGEDRAASPTAPMLHIIAPDSICEGLQIVEFLRILPDVSDVVLFLPYTEDIPLRAGTPGNTEGEQEQLVLRNGNAVDVYAEDQQAKSSGDVERKLESKERHARCLVLDSFRGVEHTVIHLNRNADMWWPLADEMPHRWVRVDLLTPRFVALLRYRSTEVCNPTTDREQKVGYEEIDRPGNTAAHNVRVPWCPDALGVAMGQGRMVEAVEAGATRPGRPAANVLGEACWRLARTVRGCSVGLALSGGGTWGASHIGVLRELERQGIPVDYVSGTSFGAWVGAIYAAGGLPAVERFVEMSYIPGLERRRDLGLILKNPVFTGLFKTAIWNLRSLGGVVEACVPELRSMPEGPLPTPQANNEPERMGFVDPEARAVSLAELPLPYFPVASNLRTQESHVSQWLDLDLGLRIACSLPPLFPAMYFYGAAMVDGAAVANVPAAEVRLRGAHHVIAINVIGTANEEFRKRTDYADPRPLQPKERSFDLRKLVSSARAIRSAGSSGSGGSGSGSSVGTGGRGSLATAIRARVVRNFYLPKGREPGWLLQDLQDRVFQGAQVLWLSLWKGGRDQSQLYADSLVNVTVVGIQTHETWRTKDVAEASRAGLAEGRVSDGLLHHWQVGGRRAAPFLERQLKLEIEEGGEGS